MHPSMTTWILSPGISSQRDGVIVNTALLLLLFDFCKHKKHLKNVGPIRHCEPPHAA